jgi:antitoxin HicB
MRTFVCAARFAPGDEAGVVAAFPDVAQAITRGDNEADAIRQAEEAPAPALATYPRRQRPVPHPQAKRGGLIAIAVAPQIAVKIALREAFKRSSVRTSAPGRRIGKDDREIRRILDPRHRTKLGTLTETLPTLGQQRVIGL